MLTAFKTLTIFLELTPHVRKVEVTQTPKQFHLRFLSTVLCRDDSDDKQKLPHVCVTDSEKKMFMVADQNGAGDTNADVGSNCSRGLFDVTAGSHPVGDDRCFNPPMS